MKSLINFFGRRICYVLIASFIITFLSFGPLHAQEYLESEKLPDDSLLIAEFVIDSIPEQRDTKHIQDMISQYLKSNRYMVDEYQEGDYKILQTVKKEVSKDLRFYDRKLEVILVYAINQDNQVVMRMYAREKINSITKDYWKIIDTKSRDRLTNMTGLYYKDLKKKLTYRRH